MDYKPRQPTGVVEDFTIPFLWSAGVVVFLVLFLIWASYGYLAAVATGFFIRAGIALLPERD